MVWMPLCSLLLIIVHCCVFYHYIDHKTGKISGEILVLAAGICGMQVACIGIALYFSVKHFDEVQLAGAWSFYCG